LNIVTKNGSLWGTDQQKAILYGNLLHLIMSKIETISDLDSASEFLRTLNAVNSEKCEELIRDAKRIVEHPELSKYFSNDIEVYNEKEIITSNGEFVRPDRLVIKDERLTVIDYKTGSSDKKHNDQINFYANVLKEMNFQIEKKLLIYTNEDLKIVEVM
jgi:ATP-dependent exoDNAse (exonuclease V) beta subunit